MNACDVLVIGAGQAGLVVGYFLRRSGLSFAILDAEPEPGGAWRHSWDSLHLFSPARWSSLPGWPMPGGEADYPPVRHVIDYLAAYEARYRLPVERPVEVHKVTAPACARHGLVASTTAGEWHGRAVVSATGTWRAPWTPLYPGQERFIGMQVHSAHYTGPKPLRGQRVLVVGAGNSAAQILAELSLHAHTCWGVREAPRFLPDDVDGRVLFQRATERWNALQKGEGDAARAAGLAAIVMVPAVREARARGVYDNARLIAGFTATSVVWDDGTQSEIDAIVWCTGFRPALQHLAALDVIGQDGRVAVNGTRSVRQPRLWLVGYGEWTGYASATLIGVMRGARDTVRDITAALEGGD